jgi:hypothetical protein
MPHVSAAAIFATFTPPAISGLRGLLLADATAHEVRDLLAAAAQDLRRNTAGAEFYVGTGLRQALALRNAEMRAAWVDTSETDTAPRSRARLRVLARFFDLSPRQVSALLREQAGDGGARTPRRVDLAEALEQATVARVRSAWPGLDPAQVAAVLEDAVRVVRAVHAGKGVYMPAAVARRNGDRDAGIRAAWLVSGPDGAAPCSAARAQQLARQHGLSMRRLRAIVAPARKGGGA